MLDVSIKVKNYKCFADDPQGFDKIYPINIIIGKNNSGKSSLVDLINYLIEPTQGLLDIGRGTSEAEVIIGDCIRTEHIESAFPGSTSGRNIARTSHQNHVANLVGSKIEYTLSSKGTKNIIHREKKPIANDYIKKIQAEIKSPFTGKYFKRITAERNIYPEGAEYSEFKLSQSGDKATNLIRKIINDAKLPTRLIKKQFLKELNNILNPDIQFNDIHIQEDNGKWEIYFDDSYTESIALSRMGSGIKTIILVLLNLIVIPEIEKISKENYVFGFEELENNLHPALQRRLFNYIAKYAKQYGAFFFITTHSSIVIDLFASDENAQLIHVENTGTNSVTKVVSNHSDSRNILKDLDYRASDILLSNGVIWVEV